MRLFTNWLRRRLNRPVLAELYAESARLATAIRAHGDPFHPTVGEQHTNGMRDGIQHAIDVIESDR